jgi:hypothetical protein
MADDVTLNAMSGGDVVSTDQAGDGSHVQVVKLAYSADGSRTPIDAGTDGLKVKVGNTVFVSLNDPIPSGTNTIGGVTQAGTWNVGITGTPTVTVGNASIPVTDNGGSLTVDGTVAAKRGSTLASSAVTVTTTATQLCAAATDRYSVGIYNNGSVVIYVGPSAVTTASGFPVAAGGALFLDSATEAAVFAIAASSTADVRVMTEAL